MCGGFGVLVLDVWWFGRLGFVLWVRGGWKRCRVRADICVLGTGTGSFLGKLPGAMGGAGGGGCVEGRRVARGMERLRVRPTRLYSNGSRALDGWKDEAERWTDGRTDGRYGPTVGRPLSNGRCRCQQLCTAPHGPSTDCQREW